MLIYCLIPARKGSKRIKNKNLILFKGKHLINHTVKHAIQSKLVNKVFVSTNDKRVSKIVPNSVYIVNRPGNISKDKSSTEESISHFFSYLKKYKIELPDAIVLLQCTSPYREYNDIDLAIKNFKKKKFDSLFSAFKNKNLFWRFENKNLKPINYNPKKRKREQEMNNQLIENGSIYIFKTKGFLKNKCRIFGKIGSYIMKRENSFQIDNYEDIRFIKKIK
jgi:N-acylneuraminate cytidylyltransferase